MHSVLQLKNMHLKQSRGKKKHAYEMRAGENWQCGKETAVNILRNKNRVKVNFHYSCIYKQHDCTFLQVNYNSLSPQCVTLTFQ